MQRTVKDRYHQFSKKKKGHLPPPKTASDWWPHFDMCSVSNTKSHSGPSTTLQVNTALSSVTQPRAGRVQTNSQKPHLLRLCTAHLRLWDVYALPAHSHPDGRICFLFSSILAFQTPIHLHPGWPSTSQSRCIRKISNFLHEESHS